MKRTFLLALTLLGGCSFAPKYVRPTPAVPQSWPVRDATLLASEADLASLSYRDIFKDPKLVSLMDKALANNQDLRAAIANVEAARGLYRVQRADLFPAIDFTGDVTRRDNGSTTSSTTGNIQSSGARTSYNVDLGTTAFELDIFGRIRNLNTAALNTYFAAESASRAVRLTLVSDVAEAYFTLAADRTLLAIAKETEANAQKSVALTQARLKGGVAPRTDLRQAETILATAQADRANLTTLVQQDRNALDLLVGTPVTDADLPDSLESVEGLVVPVAPGLDSSILLRRPDVLEAEYQLRAANARIGAARAAFFPRISLTGLAGFASNALSALFKNDSFSYTAGASATLPIFDGGANAGNLAAAKAQAEAATANYQKTIQTAFREVADALARRATIADQVGAQQRLEAAARDTAMLTEARYKGGVDSFLSSLDAQRTLYGARRSLASAQLLRVTNLIALYRAVAGDALTSDAPAR